MSHETMNCKWFFRESKMAKKICTNLRTQMNRQSWSVEAGQIAASLFSRKVDQDENARMAVKLVTFLAPVEGSSSSDNGRTMRPKVNFERGKPVLPEMSSQKCLSDFVAERSLLFLELFAPNYGKWLVQNPPWNGIPEYEEARNIVEQIKPANHVAKRLCATAKTFKVKFENPAPRTVR